MPLIEGIKYSCQPCIRGHRSSSCNHKDRDLIQVRKPGRPLESCGHRLDTCSCGRLQEFFSMDGDTFSQNQEVHVAKTKPRTSTQSTHTSKINKRASKKKSHVAPSLETNLPRNKPFTTTNMSLPSNPASLHSTYVPPSMPSHSDTGLASSSYPNYYPSPMNVSWSSLGDGNGANPLFRTTGGGRLDEEAGVISESYSQDEQHRDP
ncbi:hypothetical protein HYFRA_00007844 [Hymenoscyphus fraxineus]|uniref:Copper-fist domain-containing protein n=1 Tax=Hymenoscyphus fraxineus TaxID=746836 RepID=A0A9N9PK94_9HELO|nr:hypothetical protein HYFRA_00007844 [Hymenoscyphus fraxineus]